MPVEQKELPISDLVLVYLNGQEHGGAPVFKDVRLDRDSQGFCEDLLQSAERLDKRVRSQSECEKCLKTIAELKTTKKQLEWLAGNERKPWAHVLEQINEAISPFENRMVALVARLKARVGAWHTEVEEGRAKQREDLERRAEELEKKARYDSDSKKARQAAVEAKQHREEAKAFKPEPAKGFNVVEYYEFEIENRVLAAKFPPEAISMKCQDTWFNARIKEAKEAGRPIPTFPGIQVIAKTYVRTTQ
jgi:hypothetical protein